MGAPRPEALPANAGILRYAGEGRRAAPGEPYAIDGWELRAHPDLEERLATLVSGLRGAAMAGLRGLPVVVDDLGVVRAAATGTSAILLRLPAGPARDEVFAHGGADLPELGGTWLLVDAWASDVPGAEGTARLRGWLAAALAEPAA